MGNVSRSARVCCRQYFNTTTFTVLLLFMLMALDIIITFQAPSERRMRVKVNVREKKNPKDFIPLSVLSKDTCILLSGEEREQLPPCSNDIFREYYKVKRSFPECGEWVNTKGFGFTERYDLDFCKWEPFNLQECFLEKGVSKVAMLGDSTGWRNFMGFLNLTMMAGGHCTPVTTEGEEQSFIPNATYFAMGDKKLSEAMVVKERGCKNCMGQVYDCKMRHRNGDYTLTVEFIGSYNFFDQSLRIPPENAEKVGVPPAKFAQQYLFNTYFPATRYPDIIIISMPLNHEKSHSFSNITSDFKQLLELANEKKPNSTEIYWIPTAGEHERKRTKKRYHLMKWDGMLATDKIYTSSKLIYPILEPYLLDTSSSMYGFLNMVNMSHIRYGWSIDGVHYNHIWYSHVIRLLLAMMCS